MDLFEALEKRYSVRSFDPRGDVPGEMVERLLQSACLAPSAGNVQPWRFYVIRGDDLKAQLASAALGQAFVSQAPVVIVVCADLVAHASVYGKRGVELYSIQDCAAAVENILLAATALGLGSCWVGAFREDQAASALGLPSDIRPLAMIPLGYAAREGSQPRKVSHQGVTTYM